MPRIAALFLALAAAGRVHADCELAYAPPEIRAATLAFHHRLNERTAAQSRSIMRKTPDKSSRKPVEARASSTPAR